MSEVKLRFTDARIVGRLLTIMYVLDKRRLYVCSGSKRSIIARGIVRLLPSAKARAVLTLHSCARTNYDLKGKPLVRPVRREEV